MPDREKSELRAKMTGKAVFNTNLFNSACFNTTSFSTKVCASRYFFPDVAARMAPLFGTRSSFTE
jgi:hypothetical protein